MMMGGAGSGTGPGSGLGLSLGSLLPYFLKEYLLDITGDLCSEGDVSGLGSGPCAWFLEAFPFLEPAFAKMMTGGAAGGSGSESCS